MDKLNDLNLETLLKDYKDNERDILMFQLMIEGNWYKIDNPKYYLKQCLEMKPIIENKLKLAGYNLLELTNSEK
jgi:hypothetical protein